MVGSNLIRQSSHRFRRFGRVWSAWRQRRARRRAMEREQRRCIWHGLEPLEPRVLLSGSIIGEAGSLSLTPPPTR